MRHKILRDFKIQSDHLIPARKPELVIIKGKRKRKEKKKRTCCLVDFAVSADHKVKIKESKKRDEYLDLDRVLKKKLLSMRMILIPIFEKTIPRSFERGMEELEIRGQIETIQTTAI